MKSIAAPLLALALASTLAACTPPEDAQAPAAQPAPATTPPAAAAEAPAEPAATATPAAPALRELADAERAEAVVASTDCNLESADGVAFAGTDISPASPSSMKVSGWLKAGSADAPAEQLALRFESDDKARVWEVPLQATIVRNDLPVPDKDSVASGFEAVVDAGTLSAGRYHLYLVHRAEGALIGCDNGRHVSIL